MANETIKQITSGGVTRDIEDAAARQAAAAAYQKPADGIPKTDLAPSVQTSLGKADSALQVADKTQLQGAINSLQNALDALIGGNVQGAIDTFNEVVDFLNGIDTSDPTLKNQLLALNTAITALGNSLATVATSGSYNDLSNKPTILSQQDVAGMIEDAIEDLPTGDIPTKVSDLENDEGYIKASQMDNAPTAGSSAPVKSGGIKTALDNLLANLHIVNNEWYIGNTATGVSAQGPAGNVNITDASQLVTILVNDLTTGGAGNILSAEMGKVLKTAISTLIDSMGEYCFPNGRPTLSWEGPKCNVTQTLTDVTSNFAPSRVDKNGSLDITLTPVDNLHVFLTGDVTVEMPLGNDITSSAWNINTGKVTIADVTDDVVITAKSSTYVQSGLVFQLDCKNRGGQAGHWIDLIGNKDFTLTDVTEADSGMVFNGTSSKGEASGGLNVLWETATVEIIGTRVDNVQRAIFLANTINACVCANLYDYDDGQFHFKLASFATNGTGMSSPKQFAVQYDGLNVALSASRQKVVSNGSDVINYDNQTLDYAGGISTVMAVGYRNHATNGPSYMNGTIKAIRVYNVQLTDEQRALNYNIDKKRFNLA